MRASHARGSPRGPGVAAGDGCLPSNRRTEHSVVCSTRRVTPHGMPAPPGRSPDTSIFLAGSRTCSIAATRKCTVTRLSAAASWRGYELLQAADVVAGYPGRPPVLHQVTVEIPSGGLVGILGPNGSGKTTLLRALAGVIRPSHGQVRIDDRNLADVPKRLLAKRMAVVPQETHLAFDYSVLEVVLMGRYAHLSALELEGPGDFAIARGALAATGTLAFQNRRLRHAQRRRETARDHRRGFGADFRRQSRRRPPARRADGGAGSRLPARAGGAAARMASARLDDHRRVHPRLEFRGQPLSSRWCS